MSDQFQYDVFLSHSSKDKADALAVAERLRADGQRVWFDEWVLKPGDSIPAKIEEGLEHSRVLVLCMSAHAFGSDWARLEAGTFRFRDPLNQERRFLSQLQPSAFILQPFLDAPIKGSLAQFLYVNWLPADREQEYVFQHMGKSGAWAAALVNNARAEPRLRREKRRGMLCATDNVRAVSRTREHRAGESGGMPLETVLTTKAKTKLKVRKTNLATRAACGYLELDIRRNSTSLHATAAYPRLQSRRLHRTVLSPVRACWAMGQLPVSASRSANFRRRLGWSTKRGPETPNCPAPPRYVCAPATAPD